ncbi:CsbD family protein [Methylobacterium sp. ID0610]|uniref:CsbD family protein n=1 Tax=Methylobacterium carpenticola TaxID=3344827 RepID=UPI0036BA2CC1
MVDTDRITGAAREIGGKVQSAVGDLVGSHRDSAEGRFREAQGQAENLYGQAKDAVRHVAEDASGYAEEAYAQGGEALRHGRREVGQQVAEYPIASLLIAGLVGYGLALLVHGRR